MKLLAIHDDSAAAAKHPLDCLVQLRASRSTKLPVRTKKGPYFKMKRKTKINNGRIFFNTYANTVVVSQVLSDQEIPKHLQSQFKS